MNTENLPFDSISCLKKDLDLLEDRVRILNKIKIDFYKHEFIRSIINTIESELAFTKNIEVKIEFEAMKDTIHASGYSDIDFLLSYYKKILISKPTDKF